MGKTIQALLERMDWDALEVLRATYHALPIGVCITNPEGLFVYANHAYCEIYGYKIDELIGQSFLIVVPDENQAKLKQMHDQFIFEGREELPSFWPVRKKDGSPIFITATAHSFKDKEGITYKVTTVQDVTRQVRMEEMRKDAERIVRHDMKNPLTGVIGCTELLETETELSEIQLKYVNCIKDSGNTLLSMITHSMDRYRMEEGTYDLHPEKVPVSKMIGQIQDRFSFLLNRKGMVLKTTVSPESLELSGESELLDMMVSNLVKNSIEASPGENPILLSFIQTEAEVEIGIENSGVVPEEIRENFFQKYSTTKKNGLGLGTYSASLIARVHGGTIKMTCDDGNNRTRIQIHLPLPEKNPSH